MSISLFKSKFGKDPAEFRTLEEVHVFIKRLIRGTKTLIIPIAERDADKMIDEALLNENINDRCQNCHGDKSKSKEQGGCLCWTRQIKD